MTRRLVDDLGLPVDVPADVRRVVSLVPSLTESVAEAEREAGRRALVGATDWCTHPADLDVARIRGTKNPDVAAVVALRPDLVLANAEENRDPDLRALREAGLPVWVTDVRTVDGPPAPVAGPGGPGGYPALGPGGSLARALDACGLGRPGWLRAAERRWSAVRPVVPRRRAVVPIWRRPWMVVGSDTFTGAVLARLGVDNALADHPERYPKLRPEELPPVDLVVLPDEPYVFTADDGPEAFPGLPCALVSGRLLTWYGPSLVDAPAELLAALDAR